MSRLSKDYNNVISGDNHSKEFKLFKEGICVEYIICINNLCFGSIIHDSRTRAVTKKTNCTIEVTPRILNKRVNLYRWIKYAIIKVTGPDEASLNQCLLLLERHFPIFHHRKEYSRRANVTIFTNDIQIPDNSPGTKAIARSGSTMSSCQGLAVKSPFEISQFDRRALEQAPWKVSNSQRKGRYFSTMLCRNPSQQALPPTCVSRNVDSSFNKVSSSFSESKLRNNKLFGSMGTLSDNLSPIKSNLDNVTVKSAFGCVDMEAKGSQTYGGKFDDDRFKPVLLQQETLLECNFRGKPADKDVKVKHNVFKDLKITNKKAKVQPPVKETVQPAPAMQNVEPLNDKGEKKLQLNIRDHVEFGEPIKVNESTVNVKGSSPEMKPNNIEDRTIIKKTLPTNVSENVTTKNAKSSKDIHFPITDSFHVKQPKDELLTDSIDSITNSGSVSMKVSQGKNYSQVSYNISPKRDFACPKTLQSHASSSEVTRFIGKVRSIEDPNTPILGESQIIKGRDVQYATNTVQNLTLPNNVINDQYKRGNVELRTISSIDTNNPNVIELDSWIYLAKDQAVPIYTSSQSTVPVVPEHAQKINIEPRLNFKKDIHNVENEIKPISMGTSVVPDGLENVSHIQNKEIKFESIKNAMVSKHEIPPVEVEKITCEEEKISVQPVSGVSKNVVVSHSPIETPNGHYVNGISHGTHHVDTILPSKPTEEIRRSLPGRPVEEIRQSLPGRPVEEIRQSLPGRPVEEIRQSLPGRPIDEIKSTTPHRQSFQYKPIDQSETTIPSKSFNQFESTLPSKSFNHIEPNIPTKPTFQYKLIEQIDRTIPTKHINEIDAPSRSKAFHPIDSSYSSKPTVHGKPINHMESAIQSRGPENRLSDINHDIDIIRSINTRLRAPAEGPLIIMIDGSDILTTGQMSMVFKPFNQFGAQADNEAKVPDNCQFIFETAEYLITAEGRPGVAINPNMVKTFHISQFDNSTVTN